MMLALNSIKSIPVLSAWSCARTVLSTTSILPNGRRIIVGVDDPSSGGIAKKRGTLEVGKIYKY